MTLSKMKFLSSTGVLLAAFATQLACSTGAVHGSGDSLNRTTRALTTGELASMNGTYGAGCSHRTGSWSTEIASGATLDNAALSVLLNDSSCVLTLTSLHVTAGIIAAVPPIVLTTGFKPAASVFGSPVSFYANAKLSAVSFAGDFVVTVLFSDDALAAANNIAAFDVVVATVTDGPTPAPDYTLAVGGLLVSTDANNIVQTVTGTAGLTAGAVTGQNYVVVTGGGLLTYDAINTAFVGATSLVLAIPATDFTLVGVDLTTPAVRTLIVANLQNGVTSYESFTITFNKAP